MRPLTVALVNRKKTAYFAIDALSSKTACAGSRRRLQTRMAHLKGLHRADLGRGFGRRGYPQPTILGFGRPLFDDHELPVELDVLEQRSFGSGGTMNGYAIRDAKH